MSIDIESYVKRFALAQFSHEEQSKLKEDTLEAAIRLSANHAYSDLQLRTIHGVEKKEKEDRKNRCINRTIDIFIKYFDPEKSEPIIDQKSWDEWHEESCKQFRNDFIKDSQNKDILKQQIGKAQKMINMMFKYLYCFDALRNKGEYFKFCHMPLDKYTFEIWFKGEVLSWHNEKNSSRIYKSKICAWSKLNSSDNSYYWVQKEIRSYLESESNTKYRDEEDEKLSPFKAEFYIWEKEKAKAALKDLLKAAKEISGADNQILQKILSDMKICEDDCKNLKDCIGKICEIKKKIK